MSCLGKRKVKRLSNSHFNSLHHHHGAETDFCLQAIFKTSRVLKAGKRRSRGVINHLKYPRWESLWIFLYRFHKKSSSPPSSSPSHISIQARRAFNAFGFSWKTIVITTGGDSMKVPSYKKEASKQADYYLSCRSFTEVFQASVCKSNEPGAKKSFSTFFSLTHKTHIVNIHWSVMTSRYDMYIYTRLHYYYTLFSLAFLG